MGNLTAYIILIVAVVLGTASNGFAKGAQGFTLLIPSILTAITIVGCMYTLSLVMKEIIIRQPKFFEGDIKSLVPMKLKDLAEELKMDISTISRSTRGKYVDTPYGIFELKSFFSDGYIIKSGEEISTKIIKDFLKQLIDDEDKNEPLTDSHLADKLNIQGFPVARRTVTKYREQLQFPVARLRKQLTH